MDFTAELTAFQGAIVSSDSVHAFSRISARGGNEKKIENVIKLLQDFLSEKGLNKQDPDETYTNRIRKFAFYAVLNADLEILQELVALDGIGSVIWTVPTIPKCLLNEMLWQLYMESFVEEIIVFTYPQLSLQVTDVLIDHFKYFLPTQCLNNLKTLVTACYKFIYRLVFFNAKSIELTQAVNNFHTCLKYFYEPPNSRKLEILNKDDKYKYVGNNLYALLLTLENCFNEYTKTQKFKSSSHEIYELTYKEGSLGNLEEFNMITCSKKDIKECIENCNLELLDICKELVMEVSVEIYCAWSEFEDNGKTMQQTVGELCHKVQNTLKNINTISEHPVINMLGQISCKPIDCVDVINTVDRDTIVNNIINNNEERVKWIKAILHRDDLCSDLILVEQLTLNLTALNDEDCCKLFKICKAYLTDTSDVQENIKVMLIRSFQHCSVNRKLDLLEEHFTNSTLNDDLITTEFNNMMIEIFNKLTLSPNTDLSEVLTIFLQSPIQMYRKLFHLASENIQQTQIMVKVMKYLERFSNYYYSHETEPCILSVTKESVENYIDMEKLNNYTKFLCELKSANIIPGSKLFLLVIMPSLHCSLLKRNIFCIHMQCKLLLEAFTLDEFVEYRAPMLAMLAQVLDTVRWKITTFDGLAPSTMELGLKLLSAILDTYPQQIPDKEKSWLKVKLKNIDPLNMYYYRQLWNPPGETFLEVITGVHIFKEMDVEQLTVRLSQVLCSTVLDEWYQIWDNLSIFSRKHLFNIFHEALLLIAMAEKKNHTQETWMCLMHCFKNFTQITRYNYLRRPLDENQVLDVMQKFILLENFVEQNNVEQFSNILLPLFGYMVEKKNNLDILIIWNSLCDKVKNKMLLDFINKNIFGKTSDDIIKD